MRIIYDPQHVRHRPRTELLYGRPVPHPDQPERVEAIHAALGRSRWASSLQPPRRFDLKLAERIHEADYLAHLLARGEEMAAEGPEAEWFAYVWPHDRSLDTGTPVLADTLEAAWASACVALTGADLLLAGEPVAYALCRPPGHHAARGAMGGYCYLNNAALAASYLLEGGSARPSGTERAAWPAAEASREAAARAKRVAILDLDIHHGNGTQSIFYDRDDVLYCSLHGEPEWAYPPHTGFAEERGVGAGEGFTYNQPLPEGTTWAAYAAALDRALERIARDAPGWLILSQGFDTFEGDRWGGFLLHADDFGRIGERVRALGLPVLVVLEGGYEPANLAAGSLALVEGLAG